METSNKNTANLVEAKYFSDQAMKGDQNVQRAANSHQ